VFLLVQGHEHFAQCRSITSIKNGIPQRRSGAEGVAAGTAAGVVLPPLGFSMAGLSFLGEFITDGEKKPCIPTE